MLPVGSWFTQAAWSSWNRYRTRTTAGPPSELNLDSGKLIKSRLWILSADIGIKSYYWKEKNRYWEKL